MEDFAVPKREVHVRVLLEDGRDLSGLMYVPAIDADGGPGHLIDQLNQEADDFLVLRERQKTHVIHEARILTVAVMEDVEEERIEQQIEDAVGGRHLLVKFHLTSGAEILGNLSYVQPLEQERLQDFLNTRRRFIPLRVHSKLLYVNRLQIVSAVALRGE